MGESVKQGVVSCFISLSIEEVGMLESWILIVLEVHVDEFLFWIKFTIPTLFYTLRCKKSYWTDLDSLVQF